MSKKPLLPVGTRIRFPRELTAPASGDHPELVYATRGEMGRIAGHGTREGYWVQTDSWPEPFGASPDEIEEVFGVDGRCTRCGCEFENPAELTHQCPPGFLNSL